MILAALTGNIGSGKSTVAQMLEALGAKIIDADQLAREIVQPGRDTLSEIKQKFGASYILADGSLDRKALGQLVFSEPARRRELEHIMHPRIRSLFLAKLAKLRSQYKPDSAVLVVYVVPLLFESGISYTEIERVIVVAAPAETAIARIMARDQCSKDLAQKKYAAQMPIEEKIKRADYVVYNQGSHSELQAQVNSLYTDLLQHSVSKT